MSLTGVAAYHIGVEHLDTCTEILGIVRGDDVRAIAIAIVDDILKDKSYKEDDTVFYGIHVVIEGEDDAFALSNEVEELVVEMLDAVNMYDDEPPPPMKNDY